MSMLCIDANPYKFEINQPYVAAQGHLRCDAIVTAAKVLRYFTADGKYRDVLRHPEQVFDANSLNTLSGLPITIDHPRKNGKLVKVTPQNFKEYGHGTVGDSIHRVSPYVKIDGLNIQTTDALAALQHGNKQLSPGYDTEIVEDSGTYEGIRYTHRQTGTVVDGVENPIIVYNHLAIMGVGSFGRNGTDVRVLLGDSDDVLVDTGYDFEDEKPKRIYIRKPMKMIQVDFKGSTENYEVDAAGNVSVAAQLIQQIMMELQQLQQAVSQPPQQPQMPGMPTGFDSWDAVVDSLTELQALKATFTADSETEKFTADQVDEKIKTAVPSLVASRLKLEREATKFTADSVADLDDRALMIKIIKLDDSKFTGDEIGDAELRGLFTGTCKLLAQKAANVENQKKITTDSTEIPNKHQRGDVSANLSQVRQNLRKNRKVS